MLLTNFVTRATLKIGYLPLSCHKSDWDLITMIALSLFDRLNPIYQQWTYGKVLSDRQIMFYLGSFSPAEGQQHHLWFCLATEAVYCTKDPDLMFEWRRPLNTLLWEDETSMNQVIAGFSDQLNALANLSKSSEDRLRMMFRLPEDNGIDRRLIGLNKTALRLCDWLATYNTITTKEVVTMYNISPHAAKTILKTLQERKLVTRKGNGWTTHYRWITLDPSTNIDLPI